MDVGLFIGLVKIVSRMIRMKIIFNSKIGLFLAPIMMFVLLSAQPAHAVKVRSFCRLLGADALRVEGQGIVTGLNGTGDGTSAAKVMVKKYLEANKYNFSDKDLSTKNIAFVKVDAEIKPFSRPGDRINLRVSSIGDASSLANGVLKSCYLSFGTGEDAIVRAMGRVSIGDNPTTGIINEGGLLLSAKMLNRSVWDKNGMVRLVLNKPNFLDAATVAANINGDRRTNPGLSKVYGFGTGGDEAPKVAIASDAKEVIVKIPQEYMSEKVRYIAMVLDIDVELQSVAEIRINKQRGSAIVSGDVEVMPGFISYRGRTVTLAPPIEGQDAKYELNADDPRGLVDVFGPNESGGSGRRSLQSLVDTLAAMRCTTDDIIVILQEMKSAGLIQAELKVE